MHYDYIVVGQGLAGSLLSYFLIDKGKRVRVYDHPNKPKASRVAAGIFNPFTGRKLVKTWFADELFPYLLDFYRRLEQRLEIKLLHELPMYRPFLSIREQNEWGGRFFEPGYSSYIDSIVSQEDHLSEVENPLGGMMMKQCGYVDISKLIDSIGRLLYQLNSLKRESFSIEGLHIESNGVKYQEISASRIVFCDGPYLTNNKYFNWLPIRPVKGELLEINLEKPIDFIINRGVFVLPVDGAYCKVGATFDNHHLDWNETSKAKDQLVMKLEKLLKVPYKIVGQKAGIRPASADRRPFIGNHPEFEPLAVFNGLGTKGVSLAPYLIEQFFEFMENGIPLLPDVSISRYFSLYYSKI